MCLTAITKATVRGGVRDWRGCECIRNDDLKYLAHGRQPLTATQAPISISPINGLLRGYYNRASPSYNDHQDVVVSRCRKTRVY